MLGGAKKFLKRFANSLLDVDDTEKPASHIKMLEDYSGKLDFDTDTKDVSKFFSVLRKKHLVDEIVVATMNGSSLASSNGHAVSRAVSAAAMFSYVKSEHPKSETVLIKANGSWSMIFPHKGKLYSVRAASDLSVVELRALAREIDSFLVKTAN